MTVEKCLDHGYVRLIDHMGNDLSIVRSARVSYDAAWRAGEDKGSDDRLIKYLWKNRHTSPFESVVFTFEVKAPVFIIRQWQRHRMWSYSELSGRYKEMPNEFYIPREAHIGQQSTSNKQMRDMVEPDLPQMQAVQALREFMPTAWEQYQKLLKIGTPREIARSVLPSAIYTQMFCTVNLLNLLKFIQLRDHSHAQYEIQVYARAMLNLIRPIVPVTIAAFEQTRANMAGV